jgi:hypothetical protein
MWPRIGEKPSEVAEFLGSKEDWEIHSISKGKATEVGTQVLQFKLDYFFVGLYKNPPPY